MSRTLTVATLFPLATVAAADEANARALVRRGAARDLTVETVTVDRADSFVAADVYDAAEAVPDRAYDIVYTGTGALNWLPDVERWAEVAASLVAPGGFLYLAEFHPLTDVLDDETGSRVLHDYFARDAWVDITPGTYADLEAETVHNRSVEWQHPVGEVVSAIAAAGLRIDFLHEHEASLFPRYGTLRRDDNGYYRFPPNRARIPLMYSIRATRPS